MRTVLIPLLFSSALFAQSPEIIYHPAAEIAQTSSQLITEAGKAANGQASRTLDSQERSSVLVIVRVHTGEAELHELWADQVIIQSGGMTVVTGGSITGKHPYGTAPGEFRGTSIEGGTEHVLHAGDLLRVPAGVPHWAKLAPGQTVKYVAVKEMK